ncbi:MAG: class II glutamine amidotransferase [Nanoarchaeota archaeon]
MIVASGNVDVTKVIESAVLMAKDENSIHELNEKKGPGSCRHPDGWGAAYLNKAGEFVLQKSTQAIFEDSEVRKLSKLGKIKTSLFIIHVRKKAGSKVALENTHPFMTKHPQLGKYVFCHNGFIKGAITFDPEFKPKGETDSEKLFYSILSNIKENNETKNKENKNKEKKAENNENTETGPGTVLRRTIHKYNTEGTNVILATEERTYVAVRKHRRPKYYQMNIGQRKDLLIISSEKLKTFPDLFWKAAEQGDVITFDNGSEKYVLSKEPKHFIRKLIDIIKR